MEFHIENGNVGRVTSSIKGFTLIELLVALAIIALLLSIVVPNYFGSVDKAEITTLRENLYVTRDAIDKFYADKGRYPDSLGELVDERYLRDLPIDPITNRTDSWIIVPPIDPKKGKVFNIRSGAPGATRAGQVFASF